MHLLENILNDSWRFYNEMARFENLRAFLFWLPLFSRSRGEGGPHNKYIWMKTERRSKEYYRVSTTGYMIFNFQVLKIEHLKIENHETGRVHTIVLFASTFCFHLYIIFNLHVLYQLRFLFINIYVYKIFRNLLIHKSEGILKSLCRKSLDLLTDLLSWFCVHFHIEESGVKNLVIRQKLKEKYTLNNVKLLRSYFLGKFKVFTYFSFSGTPP